MRIADSPDRVEPIGAGWEPRTAKRRVVPSCTLNHHGIVTTLYHRLPSGQRSVTYGSVVLRCTSARTCHVPAAAAPWRRRTSAVAMGRGSEGSRRRRWCRAVAEVGCKRCLTSCVSVTNALQLFSLGKIKAAESYCSAVVLVWFSILGVTHLQCVYQVALRLRQTEIVPFIIDQNSLLI